MTEQASRETERLVARLRFRHLRLITELQRGGSLRAAAQALNLTQPALSKALAEIEGAFGFALFTRTARGLTSTAQGAVALRGAALLLAELAHLGREVAAGESAAATVRIGAPPFVAQGYLPEVLARLAQRDPPVRVQLLEERVPVLMQALQQGEVESPGSCPQKRRWRAVSSKRVSCVPASCRRCR
jgi:LysR family transcriptional regulator, regulator of abg operon